MPKLEKLSNAARLKHAKKRRQKQLKKWQEWLRMERATNGTSQRRMCQPQIGFQQEAVLNDLVARNDIIGGKLPCRRVFCKWVGRGPTATWLGKGECGLLHLVSSTPYLEIVQILPVLQAEMVQSLETQPTSCRTYHCNLPSSVLRLYRAFSSRDYNSVY